MKKISREAKVVTEQRSNFSKSWTGKRKMKCMKCMRAGNLVSKAQPWVSEGLRGCNATMESWERRKQKAMAGEGDSQHPRYLTSSRRRHSPVLWTPLKRKENNSGPAPWFLPPRRGPWGEEQSWGSTLFPVLHGWVAAVALCLSTLALHRALHLQNCLPVLDPCISLSGERKWGSLYCNNP